MKKSHVLKIRNASKLLKMLAHEERLNILCHLVDGEKSVGELLKHSVLSQSAFSQHLAKLRADGLVVTRKEEQMVFYRIAKVEVNKVIGALHQIYCG